jgi:hypothetical protein
MIPVHDSLQLLLYCISAGAAQLNHSDDNIVTTALLGFYHHLMFFRIFPTAIDCWLDCPDFENLGAIMKQPVKVNVKFLLQLNLKPKNK